MQHANILGSNFELVWKSTPALDMHIYSVRCHERDFSDFSFKFLSSFCVKINRIMTSCYFWISIKG